jgi:hypothetical protein
MRAALKIGLAVVLAGSLSLVGLAQNRFTTAEAKEHFWGKRNRPFPTLSR